MAAKNALQFVVFILYLISSSNAQSELPQRQDDTGAAMKALLRRISHISLWLRNANDADNDFVRFLLQQTDYCSLQLTIEGNISSSAIFTPAQRHRSAVVLSRNLVSVLKQYSGRFGVFIAILADEPAESELWNVASALWNTSGVLQVYYVGAKRSLYFNPFARQAGRFGVLLEVDALKSSDIFNNFDGYPMRVYIFDSAYSTVFGNASIKQITSTKGADGKVAELLSKKMNFSMDFQWPDDEFFGARLDNGSYNGAIGRLIRLETDISLTGFFVKDYLTRDIDFSVSVYMDELCCYVMKAKRIPQSILPIFAISGDMWLAFLAVGALSPLIWIIIRHLNLRFNIGRLIATATVLADIKAQYARIFIDTWVVWVRVNIVRYPPFSSERVFVISLSLVSVMVGALFESSLATAYIRPLYYKDINTLQELDDVNFRIYIKHRAMKDDLFYGHGSQVYRDLDKKLLLVAETEERLISMMSKRGGFAAVTRASALELDDIRYFITKKIYKIPECPKNYHIAFVLPKHSAFLEPINVLLLKFLAAGLIDQWINEMKHKAKISIHSFPDYVAELGDKWKVLTLKDLQLAFYALTFGCILAIFVLLCEFMLQFKCLRTLRW